MYTRVLFRTALAAAALLAASAHASTITFSGPENTSGAPCTPGTEGCVIGTLSDYTIFGASLTQPATPTGDWVLTIDTNYPATIPNNSTSIPTATWPADGAQYSISDFLITWQGNDYGIVLSPHVQASVAVDPAYQAGGLYEVPGFRFSQSTDLQNGQTGVLSTGSPRPSEPVWIDPGGTQLGSGSVLVNTTGGNGTTTGAEYQITVDFTAPSDFLSTGDFSIQMSSFVCANGLLIGSGDFGSGSSTQAVPEPRTFLLVLPLLLLAVLARQRAIRQ
jgi:hypothetical protein